MEESIVFTTKTTGTVSSVHSFEQSTLRQCSTAGKNGAVQVGSKYLFVAQAQKAVINVYSLFGQKRESVEQRLPLPEVLDCLEVVSNEYTGNMKDIPQYKLAEFNLPYLLLGSTATGKLYIWELNSGILLNVKNMAHYQSITKIKAIMQGKYVITSGNDARVLIWQTVDLVTQEEPKPIAIIHDNTLPVTDFSVSATYNEFLSTSGLKLFTVSQDTTLRCYDLDLTAAVANRNEAGKEDLTIEVRLLATFTLPCEINAISLDPADRACYLGTPEGCFTVPLYCQLTDNLVVNILQDSANSTGTKGKIYSLVESKEDQTREALYSMGQLIYQKICSIDVMCLDISMDGTLLAIGDKEGKVVVTEIYSKQILKTIQPLTTASQPAHGAVTNVLICPHYADRSFHLGSGTVTSKHTIPNLQRVIYDKDKKDQMHNIWHQMEPPLGDTQVSPLTNFEQYLDNVKSQEMIFTLSKNVAASFTETNTNKPNAEMEELRKNMELVTDAYKELRTMHEKLLEEHNQLLEKGR